MDGSLGRISANYGHYAFYRARHAVGAFSGAAAAAAPAIKVRFCELHKGVKRQHSTIEEGTVYINPHRLRLLM
jgi:hypothetical protein